MRQTAVDRDELVFDPVDLLQDGRVVARRIVFELALLPIEVGEQILAVDIADDDHDDLLGQQFDAGDFIRRQFRQIGDDFMEITHDTRQFARTVDGEEHILEHFVEVLQRQLQFAGQTQWPDRLFERKGKIGIGQRQFDVVDATLVDGALDIGHHNRCLVHVIDQAILSPLRQAHILIGPFRSKMARQIKAHQDRGRIHGLCKGGRAGKGHLGFHNAHEQGLGKQGRTFTRR